MRASLVLTKCSFLCVRFLKSLCGCVQLRLTITARQLLIKMKYCVGRTGMYCSSPFILTFQLGAWLNSAECAVNASYTRRISSQELLEVSDGMY